MTSGSDNDVVTGIIRAALDAQGRGAQAELARRLGVLPQVVNKWFLGKNAPEMRQWPAIEEALGLDDGTLREAAGLGVARSTLEARVAELERKVDLLLVGQEPHLRLAAQPSRGERANQQPPPRKRAGRPRPAPAPERDAP